MAETGWARPETFIIKSLTIFMKDKYLQLIPPISHMSKLESTTSWLMGYHWAKGFWFNVLEV